MLTIARLLLLASLVGWTATAQATQDRVALVVGNSAYSDVPALKNPLNDAADIAIALEGAGFEVERQVDLGFSDMVLALKRFQARASEADVAVIYYAGHGIEVDRTNFMIPVDASLVSENDIDFEAIPLDLVVRAAGQASTMSLVIVDACRNNPFAAKIRRSNGKRSIGRGLGAIEPVGNTLVAYAAREGTEASDGSGRNSPYAAALADALQEPGLEIGKLFRQVRDDVLKKTNGAQEPFLYGSLSADDFYFQPPKPTAAALPPAPSPASQSQRPANMDALLWNAAETTGTVEAYRAYLDQFPEGTFAAIASIRIAALRTEPEAAPASATLAEPTPDLLRGIQTELNRLGCSAGTVDGIWGRRSQAALDLASKEIELASTEPTGTVLSALRRHQARACPVVCDVTEVLSGEVCVRKTCPGGQRLSSRGQCYKPEPVQAVPKADCFTFNGKQVCS